MKTELAPAQIENYQKEGWLIVDDFLAPDELRALNTAVDTGVETMGGNKVSGEHNESIKDDSETYIQPGIPATGQSLASQRRYQEFLP